MHFKIQYWVNRKENHMFKKIFYILILGGILAGFGMSLVGCSSSHAPNTLTIGLQSGYPPYEYVDEHGVVVGFDADVAQKIADSMHKKLVVKEMGFDSLILSLKNHKIDLIVSGMSITNERLKSIDMVPYYGDKVTDLKLLFWGKEGSPIETLDEKTVAVQSGTFQEQILHHYSKIKPKLLENTQELVMDIKYGKSAAALVETAIGNECKYKYPEIHLVNVPLAPEDQVMGNGIGVAKDHPELKLAVEEAVKEMKEKGQMNALAQKWFHD